MGREYHECVNFVWVGYLHSHVFGCLWCDLHRKVITAPIVVLNLPFYFGFLPILLPAVSSAVRYPLLNHCLQGENHLCFFLFYNLSYILRHVPSLWETLTLRASRRLSSPTYVCFCTKTVSTWASGIGFHILTILLVLWATSMMVSVSQVSNDSLSCAQQLQESWNLKSQAHSNNAHSVSVWDRCVPRMYFIITVCGVVVMALMVDLWYSLLLGIAKLLLLLNTFTQCLAF